MANKSIRNSSRYLAMTVLEKVNTKGAFSNIVLNQTIEKENLSREDSNLLTEIVYGVIQRKRTLDYILMPYLNQKKKIEQWVIQLLRLSVYQLYYLERVPDHAVLNEAVNIAKVRGHKGISGLVNGVLRNVLRGEKPDFSKISDPVERLGVQYSLPDWIIDQSIQQLGMDETEKYAQSLLDKSKVSLRVNTTQISVKEAIEQLTDEGYTVKESRVSPHGLISESGLPARSELFKTGKITIQDETSMLVAPALGIQSDDKVLDACAAPGGKTTHIAAYLDNEKGGEVLALDLHAHKIKLIEENAQRQRVRPVVKTKNLDARKISEEVNPETFDKILVDAPCSGLGLMRRKPEIRYSKTPEDLSALKKIQIDILSSVAPFLKKDGRLVYSTCTITQEENEQVIEAFLADHPDFSVEPVLLENEQLERSKDQMLRVYPHQYGTDGFFICSLRRQK
ncbi:16S rRNA (cytosine(967)-C(5))-methyltransferase RsmB [Marinilactibacillus piezotolerans]|uniref:16S rRNA (cytosine(967)-C(5))-methyltransferase RsmB n=1 Tax=Marinilactibacillus piezotolerans TaxID=258723 RepID=UPI002118C63C|nr:16S rRNA (cytosine(967)-C(5))-methyltransferase RsmB [Marinilactibacillus piezotolerans]